MTGINGGPNAQPANWRYSIAPGGISLATYPGNVQFDGIVFDDVSLFSDVATVQASRIPSVVNSISTVGYYSAGDGGGAQYIRAGAPAPGSIQSLDGQNWTLRISGRVNVRQFGARGDGATNDAPAFQSAINSGAQAIYIPSVSNSYRLTASLTISNGVLLLGDGTDPFGVTGPNNNRGQGSWLFFDHSGVGLDLVNGTAPGFIATVRLFGIGTVRNHTNPVGPGWTPTVFNWDIRCNNCDLIIDDVMLFNPYRGILVENGLAGRLTANNLRGQWFLTGIDVSNSLDVCRFNNIQQWPFWQNETNVTNWQQSNTTIFSFTRCDNPQLSNVFSIFQNIGIALYQSAAGKTLRMKGTNIEFDFTNYGLFVDAGVSDATGVFANFSIYGQNNYNANGYGNRILGSFCRFDFQNIEGANLSRGLVAVEGSGNVVTMSGVRASFWNLFGAGSALVACNAGNTINIANRITADGPANPLFFAGGTIRYPGGATFGQANIAAASTSVVVNHGQAIQPQFGQIQLTPTTGLGAATEFWVSNITATQFTINLDLAPGGAVTVSWRCALD